MTKLFLTLIICVSFNAFAGVEAANVHTVKGVMPNPVLAPFGQLVNIENGDVLYVNSIISVLSPEQLRDDCIYEVHFTRDVKIKSRVQLVPPMIQLSCGHDFGASK